MEFWSEEMKMSETPDHLTTVFNVLPWLRIAADQATENRRRAL
jgi:hypothetical protein